MNILFAIQSDYLRKKGSMQNNFVVSNDYVNNKVNSLFFSGRICPGHDYSII